MSDLLASIKNEALTLVEPLVLAASAHRGQALLLRSLGYLNGTGPLDTEQLLSAVAAAAAAIESLPSAELTSWRDFERLRTAAANLANQVGQISGAVDATLGRELCDLLLSRYLRRRAPRLFYAGGLLTVVEPAEFGSAGAVVFSGDQAVRFPPPADRFPFARLGQLLRAPGQTMAQTFLPNQFVAAADAHAGGARALRLMGALAGACGATARIDFEDLAPPADAALTEDPESGDHLDDAEDDSSADPAIDTTAFLQRFRPRLSFALVPGTSGASPLSMSIAASSAQHPGGAIGYVVRIVAATTFSEERGDWRLSVVANGDLPACVLGPGGFTAQAELLEGATAFVTFAVTRPNAAGASPFALGPARGTRLEIGEMSVEATAQFRSGSSAASLTAAASQTALVIAPSDGDGFLRRVLPRELRIPFSTGIVLSTATGVHLVAGSGLEVPIVGEVRVGPVRWSGGRLSVTPTDSELRLAVTGGLSVKLGPVQVGVEDTGLAFAASMPQGGPWPGHLTAYLQRPTGVHLTIDAGSVSGGGFLQRGAGGYHGALSLDFLAVSIAALAVLDTTDTGYSLAAVISTGFPPVQLGFGFTLDGVGGLIGINRRVDVDALRAAMRGPGLADIFFAADPIGHAARLTGDLARYFPAAEGRHVFGPAFKLGWGTPSIVTADLAVLLEVPSPVRVVLLGTASAALPSQDHPIIDLNVDVVGEIDFSQRRVAIDASLRDSKVAGFPILGDLALRMHVGDPPSFTLAVGGFHSQFRVPPGFPELRPIQIPIGTGDDPRLDLQGFVALTSNTAQIGAQAHLYASAGPLNITGDLGFEALIIFSPFSFQVDVWAGVKLRRGSTVLAGVHFDGRVRGPWPWFVDGEASLSLWFAELRVPVHFSFGAGHPIELPTRAIWPLLRPEVERAASWGTQLPAGVHAVVTAPPSGEAATPRVDPGATLTLRQKVAPLDRRITSFAHGRPDGPDEFRVSEVRLGGTSVPFTPVSDWFAPAQFEAMSEADQLSRPGFERMTAGVSIGGDVMRTGAALTTALEYETVVWADNQRQTAAPYRPSRAEQVAGTAVSSVARAPLRIAGTAAFAPPPATPPRFVLQEETYVIASTYDLQPRWDLTGAVTRGQAELALRAHLASTPADAGKFQVVPAFEVAA